MNNILLRPLMMHGLTAVQKFIEYKSVKDASMIKLIIEQRDKYVQTKFMYDGSTHEADLQDAPSGSYAIVPLKGVMMSEDGLCQYGIGHTCASLEIAAENPNIEGIIIDTNSGGGEVAAAQKLANTLLDIKGIKPIIQYINGMSASGAVFSGVLADRIIAGGATAEIGSIGVVVQVPKEYIGYYRDEVVSIYADGSEDKHSFVKNLIAGDYESIKQEELNPIREEFRKKVRQHRVDVNDSALAGKVYLAGQAKKLGLIDEVGTMKSVYNNMETLIAKERKKSIDKSLQNINF